MDGDRINSCIEKYVNEGLSSNLVLRENKNSHIGNYFSDITIGCNNFMMVLHLIVLIFFYTNNKHVITVTDNISTNFVYVQNICGLLPINRINHEIFTAFLNLTLYYQLQSTHTQNLEI